MSESNLSPDWVIHNVSEDIWRTILTIVLDDMETKKYTQTPTRIEKSLHLSHVCSSFYNTIAKSPELWRDITIGVNRLKRTFPVDELLVLALQRASSTPLRLTLETAFKFKFYRSISDDQKIELFTARSDVKALESLNYFTANVQRAKEVKMDFTALNFFAQSLEKDIGRDFGDYLFFAHCPLLESLELIGNPERTVEPSSSESSRGSIRLVTFLEKALCMSPNIKTVILRGDGGNPRESVAPLNRLKLHLSHLVHLEITEACVTCGDLLSYLSDSRKLVRCRIDRVVTAVPSNIIFISALQELTLFGSPTSETDSFCPSSPLSRVLSVIVTPSLTSLVLRWDREQWHQTDFLQFLGKSGLHLKHLILDRLRLTEGNIIECLSLLSNLESFEIHSRSPFRHRNHIFSPLLTCNFSRAMAAWDTSSQTFKLCPRLEYFAYNYLATDTVVDEAILSQFIETRWKCNSGPSCLKIVSICGAKMSDSTHDIRRLLELKKEGLSLVLLDTDCFNTDTRNTCRVPFFY